MFPFAALAAVFLPASVVGRNLTFSHSSAFVQTQPSRMWATGDGVTFSDSVDALISFQPTIPWTALYWIGQPSSDQDMSYVSLCVDCDIISSASVIRIPSHSSVDAASVLYSITDLPIGVHTFKVWNNLSNSSHSPSILSLCGFIISVDSTIDDHYPVIINQGAWSASCLAVLSILFPFLRRKTGKWVEGHSDSSTHNLDSGQVLDITSPASRPTLSPPGSASTAQSQYATDRPGNPQIMITSPTVAASTPSAYSTRSGGMEPQTSFRPNYETPYEIDERELGEFPNGFVYPPSPPLRQPQHANDRDVELGVLAHPESWPPASPPLPPAPTTDSWRFSSFNVFKTDGQNGSLSAEAAREGKEGVTTPVSSSSTPVTTIPPIDPTPPAVGVNPHVSIPVLQFYRPPPGQPQPTTPSEASAPSTAFPTSPFSASPFSASESEGSPGPRAFLFPPPPRDEEAGRSTSRDNTLSLSSFGFPLVIPDPLDSARSSSATSPHSSQASTISPITELLHFMHSQPLASPPLTSIASTSPTLSPTSPEFSDPPDPPRGSRLNFFIPPPPPARHASIFPPTPLEESTGVINQFHVPPLRVQTPPRGAETSPLPRTTNPSSFGDSSRRSTPEHSRHGSGSGSRTFYGPRPNPESLKY